MCFLLSRVLCYCSTYKITRTLFLELSQCITFGFLSTQHQRMLYIIINTAFALLQGLLDRPTSESLNIDFLIFLQVSQKQNVFFSVV